MNALAQRFERLRVAVREHGAPSLRDRREHLTRLVQLMRANEHKFAHAIGADFGHRSPHESRFADVWTVVTAALHARRNVRRWMRPRRVATSPIFWPGRNYVHYEPLGVVGVMAPWNYPVNLLLIPLVDALAAGNRVMLKPSELTPRTSALLAELVAGAFEPDHVTVVEGDLETARQFAALPFDHLVFTGSAGVARSVMAAAAANLTPVTLELGGKSPALIHESYDVAAAATKVAIGKLFNAGQTCVAADYVLVARAKRDAFVTALAAAMAKLYPRFIDNPDYSAILAPRHYQRLVALVEEARQSGASVIEINPAGETSSTELRKLLPVLVLEPKPELRLMQEEIFGPVLPILSYDTLDEALSLINAGGKPLAFYYFDDSAERAREVLARTSSGSLTVNETLLQFVQSNLPLGGVGHSGMGKYHGHHGFLTLSNARGVFVQSRLARPQLLYPPYRGLVERILRWLVHGRL